MVQAAPFAKLDASANFFMFDNKLFLGAAYRWDAALSALEAFMFLMSYL